MEDLKIEVKYNTLPNHEKLLRILRQSKKSLPSTSLALLAGLSMVKIDRILETCSKHNLCRKTTKKAVNYWKWVGDDE